MSRDISEFGFNLFSKKRKVCKLSSRGKILVDGGTWRWVGFYFDGILKNNLYFCIKFLKLLP